MVSVVIPAYNEEKFISHCLEALIRQTTKEPFEVVLVDNNSTDRTVEVAQTFNRQLKLRIVSEKQKGRGAARHKGFTEAKGEIILSSDADTIVPDNWISTLVERLKTSNSIAVSGTCKITDCDPLTNFSLNFFQPLGMRFYRVVFGHYWLSGFSFAIYRDIYNQSGGFNPKLNGQEDIDLSFRVAKLGNIKLIPDLPVIFSGRRFKKGLLMGLIPYAKTFADYYLFKKENFILKDVR